MAAAPVPGRLAEGRLDTEPAPLTAYDTVAGLRFVP